MRGDGAGEDVDGDLPPPNERIVGDDNGDDFPLPEGSAPVEQLRQSPRLVPPRFRLVAAESCPESLLTIFFLIERLHIAEDGHRRATRGPRGRGAPPTLVGRVWLPSELLALSIFYIF